MRIRLERLKSKPGKKWADERPERLVRILSGSWYWRKNRCGYTDEKAEAGIYTFSDALDASAHCGPEKCIIYEFLPAGEGEPTQEPKGKAKLLLKAV